MDIEAAPLVNGTVPRSVAPSRNCMVPVAVDGETAALNVTGCPTVAGFGDVAKVLMVAALVMISVTTTEVLAELLVSPE